MNNTIYRDLTQEDYIRYSNLLYEIRQRPFKNLFRGKCKTAIEMLQFINKYHLESEYNRISNILYKNGFIGAVLTIYAVYIAYFDLYEMEGLT